ncbi:hypothetical protein DPMN_044036 [Dreissena polymorpha]|uniref:BEN domain-containing protein n=1 Tax=Dreissena polymorpha TaxID=45954 RepID=A0A9D4D1N5_DREPO|nr:hypothetical protein DPMN_044036 [Dreissena polymorpha]
MIPATPAIATDMRPATPAIATSIITRPTPARRVSATMEPGSVAHILVLLNRMEAYMADQTRAMISMGKRLTKLEAAVERLEVSLASRQPLQPIQPMQPMQPLQPLQPILPDPDQENQMPKTGLVDKAIVDAINREANNEAHFACLLLPHVFPELFGVDKLRLLFNWNGAAGKQALDASRKAYIENPTKFFYPDARSTSGWTAVVLRINERLRRKEKKKKDQQETERLLEEGLGELSFFNL